MEKLSPETPEDFLFKGYAVANHDPGLGLAAINEAIHRRPSMTVAFLLRAEVRAWQAQEAGDPAQAEEAVKEAKYAKEQLPDNPAALWVSLHANLIAAAAYQRRGQPDKRQEALERARKDAHDLEGFTALPDAVVFRWLYFREVGQEYELLPELRRSSQETDHQYAAFYYALTLYRRGEFKEAAATLEKKQGCCVDCLRPFVLAEDTDPERGRILAKNAYDELATRYRDGWTLMSAQTVLRLLGDKDAARAVCAELKNHPEWFPVLRPATKQFLEYNAGNLTADQLDKATASSLWDQCDAHFFIAMTLLADGHRQEACAHFRKVLATRAFFFNAYDFSWVFLDRLEKDPHWPPWVPQSKNNP
jgi:tetratricopeptide (TPR) repeat protein